jgi:O-methyltransferase
MIRSRRPAPSAYRFNPIRSLILTSGLCGEAARFAGVTKRSSRLAGGALLSRGTEMLSKNDVSQKYIELLKKSLVGELHIENECRIVSTISFMLQNRNFTVADFYHVHRDSEVYRRLKQQKYDATGIVLARRDPDGSLMPAYEMHNFTELAHTMIGMRRMDNIQYCIETVLDDDIAGDLIETGVWRGGATIFMRGVLAAYGIKDRTVWVADSFDGVPPPTLPEDAGLDLSKKMVPFLAVSKETVAELFERYGLLDAKVKFLAGWFKDTLPVAPIETISVLRLDGDLYESTMDALNPLYAKVSRGGFIIVDDYNTCPPCRKAIHDFRAANGITDEMVNIDNQSLFWRKR